MRIDLHCHSTHSDGSLPAAEVAKRAVEREVTLFCLTDHDSCEGTQTTRTFIPNALRGVELSCVHDGRTVHLLIYERPGRGDWSLLEKNLVSQRQVRRDRVQTIADRLAALDVHIDVAKVLQQTGTVGRPHIAEELVRIGAVKSRVEAFDRYLKDGGPGDVQVTRLSLAEGLALGQQAGGCMSLAHPHIQGNRVEDIIREHKPLGLGGLEVYYAQYNGKQRKVWASLADTHGLVATGGSDFHGATLPKVTRLGVDVPKSVGQKLCDWLEVSPS